MKNKTFKACTDLDQAKKLSKILPLESADMWFQYVGASYNKGVEKPIYFPMVIRNSETDKDIPCWSLAALLSVIPKIVKIKGRAYSPCLFPLSNGQWIYKLWYNSNEIIHSPVGYCCDNIVDCCYEMILRLHELKKIPIRK